MTKSILTALALICLQATPSSALSVNTGQTIRGAYSFATSGLTGLEPTSFLLRLSSADLFGGTDAVGIRYLDNSLNPLTFSRFDAGGTALDPTIGLTFNSTDFLPGVLNPTDPLRVPRSGFIEIMGLAGSFDVSAIDLFATEFVSVLGSPRQVRVTEFQYVTTAPAPVPLPATGLFLASGLLGLFGARAKRRADIS